LEAACAVGVSSTFRSPIGGVLFSIEVTSTYYMVANYWKGFLAAISALLMSHLIDVVVTLDTEVQFLPTFYVDYPSEAYFLWELPIFAILGIFLGGCGALSVTMTKHLGRLKGRLLAGKTAGQREAIWGFGVALLTSTVYLLGPFAHRSNGKNIKELVDTVPLNNVTWAIPRTFEEHIDSPYAVCIPLMLFFMANLVLGALSLTVAVPCGCILPLLAGGASFGRMVGEIVQLAVPHQNSLPAGYALVGAAAFTAGATRTVSIAVICLELTGQMEFLIPVFVGVFAACITGSRYSLSIYDSILRSRKLPYLPNVTLKPDSIVSEIMTKDVSVLSKSCTTFEMLKVLKQKFDHDVPIVDSTHTNLLHGSVSKHEIEEVVRQFYAEHSLEGVEEDVRVNDGNLDRDTLSPLRGGGKEEKRKKELLGKTHELLHHREIHVQAAPFTLNAQTPCDDVHIIFTMLKCKSVYVLSYGMLVGVVTKDDLFAANVDADDVGMDIYASLRVPRKTYRSMQRGVRGSVRSLFKGVDVGKEAEAAKKEMDVSLAEEKERNSGGRGPSGPVSPTSNYT